MDSIALVKIRTDGGTQMRLAIDNETMLDYRDKWKSGVEFNPVDVFYDGATYWLADGFHRFYGAREAKRKDIPATIHNGSVRDAILFACGANNANGLRRTNADKRNSVEVLLADDQWSQWSDRAIAERCGVSHQHVCDIRKQLSTVDSCDEPAEPARRMGRDGKRRSAKKKTNKPAKQQSNGKPEKKKEPEPPEPTPFDHLKHWWQQANETQRCLFRNWIDGNL